MATIINERDILLLATSPRMLPVGINYISLAPTTNVFTTTSSVVSPTNIVIRANLSGELRGTVTWTTSPTVAVTINDNIITIPSTSVPFNSSVTVTATLVVYGQTYTSSTIISHISETAVGSLSTNSLTISTAADGTGGVYTTATSTMSVKIGAIDSSSNYSYSWDVPLGVTATGAATRTISVSDMTIDTAKLICTATRTNWPDEVSTFTISKSKSGTSPIIVSIKGTQALAYNAAGTTPLPASITFTATAKNVGSKTYYYRFKVDGITLGTVITDNNGSVSSAAYTPPISYFDTPKTVLVEISTTVDMLNIVDTDTMTLVSTKPGVAGTNPVLVSIKGTQAVSYNAAGTSRTPTTITFGAVAKNVTGTYYYKFSVDGVQLGTVITNSSGTVSSSAYTTPTTYFDTPKTVQVDISSTVDMLNILDTDSISLVSTKVGATGDAGIAAYLTNPSHDLAADSGGVVIAGSYTDASTLFKIVEGGNTSTGWAYAVTEISAGVSYRDATNTTPRNTLVAIGSFPLSITSLTVDSGYIDITATKAGYDPITLRFNVTRVKAGAAGAAGIAAYLTNPTHDLIASSSGTIGSSEYTAAATSFVIVEGGNTSTGWAYAVTEISAGVSYKDNTNTTSRNTLVAVGSFPLSITNLTADSGYIDITATKAGYASITLRFSITRVKAGVPGTSPILVSIKGTQAIAYNAAGTTPSPSSIIFNATAKNVGSTTTYYYIFKVDGIQVGDIVPSTTGTAPSSIAYTAPTNYFDTPKSISVEISATADMTAIIDSDTMSLVSSKVGATGDAGIAAYLTNPTHDLAANSAGVISDYTTASTNFNIVQGGVASTGWSYAVTEISAGVSYKDNTNTTPRNTLVAVGSFPLSITSLTEDSGYIDITATKAGYTSITLRFSVTRVKAGLSPILVSIKGTQAFNYNVNGLLPQPSSTTFTATARNVGSSTIYYRFKVDDVQLGTVISNTTGLATSATYTAPANYFDTPKSISVEISATADMAVIIDSDIMSLVSSKVGATGDAGIAAYLTNPTHDLAASSAGVIPSTEYTAAATSFVILQGGVASTGWAYAVTEISTGVSYKDATNTTPRNTLVAVGSFPLSITSLTADSGYIDITATKVGYTSITLRFSVTRVKAGVSPVLVSIKGPQAVAYNAAGTTPSPVAATFSSDAKNATDTTTYHRFSVDTVQVGTVVASTTGVATASIAYDIPTTYFATPKTVLVEVSSTPDMAAIIDSDSISLVSTKVGDTGTPGANATILTITGPQAVSYDAAGATPAPTTATYTATFKNAGTTTYYYRFKVDGVILGTIITNNTGTVSSTAYTIPTSYFTTPKIILVEVSDVVGMTTILDSTTLSLAATKVGTTGSSYRICYSKTSLATLSGTAITTTGSSTFPPNGSFGAGTVWAGTPQTLASGESLYQSDGIYSTATNETIWNTPYLSSLKVGSLSAIQVNTGALTVSGTLTVNTTGNIEGGQTDYNTGTGFFLGYSSGAYKFSIGAGTITATPNATGDYLTIVAHGLSVGDTIYVVANNGNTDFTATATYYVKVVLTVDRVQLMPAPNQSLKTLNSNTAITIYGRSLTWSGTDLGTTGAIKSFGNISVLGELGTFRERAVLGPDSLSFYQTGGGYGPFAGVDSYTGHYSSDSFYISVGATSAPVGNIYESSATYPALYITKKVAHTSAVASGGTVDVNTLNGANTAIYCKGRIDATNNIRCTGSDLTSATVFPDGKGLEVSYVQNTSSGYLQSYDRTADIYTNLTISASFVQINGWNGGSGTSYPYGLLGIGCSAFGAGAQNVIAIAQSSTIPTTSPLGIGQIYVNPSGDLYFRRADGVTTKLN